ncbi:MAG: M48 family metalloprotease, partial [Gammaproteobacteria bacterium]|nr:M48 family metalloprotease [Gammaproteobacteria bacterium]
AALCGLQTAQADNAKGAKLHQEIIARTPLYDDPELAAYVDRVGQKLAANSDEPNVEYKFYVLDDPTINAFTPGHGLIYMNRGLLTLMVSEGQLAGVLAHEIGHNTGNHIGRRKTQQMLGSAAAIAASVLAQNSNVGDAINISNQARISGYGREMELEADQSAAEYLYRSNYDPDEMLSMLGILKDEEKFRNLRNEGAGGSYHGVFASHPRSDKRLQEVIKKAGTLPPGESFRGREEFRKVLSGVVFGQNYTGNKREDQERYTHKSLGITFVYPKDWSRVIKGKNIVLKDPAKTVQLKITIEKTVDKSLSSQQVLEAKYPDDLTDVTKIDEQATKDLGALARRPQQRVAVIQVGRNTYHFQGIAKNNQLTDQQDQVFVEIIKSFRRGSRQDLSADEVKTIYFKRLEPGETFASLAADNELGKFTEGYLRLMNGYYPKGEAEPGTYIKLVK